MLLHLLSDVRQVNNVKLGELRHVVCDPESKQIISLVVQQSGIDGRAVIVPIDVVANADDDAVSILLDGQQFNELQPYGFSVNVAPPPADVADEVSPADFEEEFIPVPDVPPIGAAEGITSIAFTPIVEEFLNVPEGGAVIGDMTSVVARDGEIGNVERLVVDDESKTITALIAQKRGLFLRSTEIGSDLIDHIASDTISVAANISDLVYEDQE